MLPLTLPLAFARMCSSLSAPLAQLTSPVYTRRILAPSLILVSQKLQSFYLQDMRRVLTSGQTSVWQRGNEKVRCLPPVLEEKREGLALLPPCEDSQTVVLNAMLDLLASAINHPCPPCFPSEVPTMRTDNSSRVSKCSQQRRAAVLGARSQPGPC